MDGRAGQIMPRAVFTALDKGRLARGHSAVALILAFCGTALVTIVALGAPSLASVDISGLWPILRFTLAQAFLSTLISVSLAIPAAFALDQFRTFPGRSAVIALFGLPLSLPALAGAFGILALLGRNGWLAQVLGGTGFAVRPNIYGLSGVLIAHVFFNFPLAVRLFLNVLETVPEPTWKLAAALRMSALQRFRILCAPVLRASFPGVCALIFLLCMTSFTLVLVLGGGPSAATLEVAIYQSLTFDLDLGRAAALTLIQIALACAALGAQALAGAAPDLSGGGGRSRWSPALAGRERLAAAAVILVSVLFVAAPFAAIIADGIRADHPGILTSERFGLALRNSFLIAAAAASAAVTQAAALAAASFSAQQSNSAARGLFRLVPALALAFPPVVLGAGWFILAARGGNPDTAAIPLVIAVNAVMALPFAQRILEPAFSAAAARNDRLCQSLRIAGINRLRLVDFPSLRRPLMMALLFAMALSLGDFGAIALFGSGGLETLPSLLFAKLGSYRTDDAAGIALYLTLLSTMLAAAANWLQKGGSHE
jgi:thiamine transport system permease protein